MKQYINGEQIYTAGTILIYLGKQIINPSEDLLLELGFEELTKNITVLEAIDNKITEIDAYDTSSNVNLFYIGSRSLWIPRETRVSLMNSTTIQKEMGEESITYWFEGVNYLIPIDEALEMLKTLEIYAFKCYNMTATHKYNVKQLTDIEAILEYDYTVGYPEKVHFEKPAISE